MTDPADPREDRLAELMAQYDAVLAAGRAAAGLDESLVSDDPELEAEWSEAKLCLELLDRSRRRRGQLPSADDTPSPLPPADTLALRTTMRRIGRFEIERELGRGGLGVVFLATDPKLGRKVALKIPRFETLIDDDLRRRFIREAEAAARLNHPNLVALYEVGEDGAVCYLATEFCPGPTLTSWLRDHAGPIDVRQAARLVEQLALAVQHAHSRGVLHRDIKPSNVLLEPTAAGADGGRRAGAMPVNPKLTDFGMAKIAEGGGDQTRTGAVIGTPAYMAPEQAQGRVDELDARTDVYALGAVLYELLTGRPPYRGTTDADTLRKIVSGEIVGPRRLRRDVPRDLEAIVLRALAHSPVNRYATAHELATDLGRFLSGQPTLARPHRAWERSIMWTRRRPALAALIAVCLLAAATVVGTASLYARRMGAAATELATANRQLGAALGNARELLYAADMRNAFDAWKHADLSALEARLAPYVPAAGEVDLRTWVWHFLWRQATGDGREAYQHSADVYAVAVSADGRLVASAGADRSVRLWDLAENRLRGQFAGHAADVNDLAFSPDGKWLASTSDDATVRMWVVDGSAEPRILSGFTDQSVYGIAFSPDGKLLAAAAKDAKVYVWNTADGTLLHSLADHIAAVNDLAFSPDGQRLVTASDDTTARVYEASTGRLLLTLTMPDAREDVSAVAFSHDGQTLATGSLYPAVIRLWDAHHGTAQNAIASDDGWLHALAFSPDDLLLATGSGNGAIRLWDVEHSTVAHQLLGHRGKVRDLAFAADGRRLLSASSDRAVRDWNLTAIRRRDVRWRAVSQSSFERAAYSPDGGQLALIEYSGRIQRWDLRRLEQIEDVRASKGSRVLAFSPDGRRIIYASDRSRQLLARDLSTGRTATKLASRDGEFESAAMSANGTRIAAGDSLARLGLWDAASGLCLARVDTAQQEVLAVLFVAPDRIATAGHTGVKLWDAGTLSFERALPDFADKVWALAVSPDGATLAAATAAGPVRLWSLPTCEPRGALVGHVGFAHAVCFSPDGRTLVSTGDDGTVRLWDTRTWQAVAVFDEPQAPDGARSIKTVCFSPGGGTLTYAGNGREITGMGRSWSAAEPDLPPHRDPDAEARRP